jgi:hypothetical protein
LETEHSTFRGHFKGTGFALSGLRVMGSSRFQGVALRYFLLDPSGLQEGTFGPYSTSNSRTLATRHPTFSTFNFQPSTFNFQLST